MFTLHVIAAVLASFRINDLVTIDIGPGRIFERIRQAAKSRNVKLFDCYRCASLTVGGAVCSMFLFLPMFAPRMWWMPFLNYPLAMSCLAILYAVKVAASRETNGKEILVSLSDRGELTLVRSDVLPEQASKIFEAMAAHIATQANTMDANTLRRQV